MRFDTVVPWTIDHKSDVAIVDISISVPESEVSFACNYTISWERKVGLT